MAIPSFLIDSENWAGTYYELAIELSPKGDDAKILAALDCISNIPQFRGAWNHPDDIRGKCTDPPHLEDYQPIAMDSLENQFVGTLTFGDEIVVGCTVIVIREDKEDGSDWIDIAIPLSMLERVFPVDYPLTLTKNPWIQEVDDQFLDIAKRIYNVVAFQLAIIGEEVSGRTYHHRFSPRDVNRAIYVLPKELAEKASEFCNPLHLTADLSYLPMDD